MTRYPLRLVQRRQESPDAVSLSFEVPVDLRSAFTHQPGQFVSVAIQTDGQTLERSYSISSLPRSDAPMLRITVKRVPGGKVSNWLVDQACPGQLIDVATPRGRFYVDPREPVHAVLLGAGSGVAPLVPIARTLCAGGRHRVTFACGQRTAADLLLRDEIEALCGSPGCTVLLRLSRAGADGAGGRGRIDRAFVADQVACWRKPGLPLQVYLCGPEAFMNDALDALRSAGIPDDQIRRESFTLCADADSDEPGLVVAGAEAGETGDCAVVSACASGMEGEATYEAGEGLLASLLRANAAVPYSCQEGTCASCIAALKHGTVELHPAVLRVLGQSDLDQHLILACLARPRSTRVHIDFDDL